MWYHRNLTMVANELYESVVFATEFAFKHRLYEKTPQKCQTEVDAVVDCMRTAMSRSQLPPQFEFLVWLCSLGYCSIFDSSVANGFGDMETIASVVESHETDSYIRKWVAACELDTNMEAKIRRYLPNIHNFRCHFVDAQVLLRKQEDERAAMIAFCCREVQLVAYKRGITRKEKWCQRVFYLFRGVLRYGKVGGPRQRGGAVLENAAMIEVRRCAGVQDAVNLVWTGPSLSLDVCKI